MMCRPACMVNYQPPACFLSSCTCRIFREMRKHNTVCRSAAAVNITRLPLNVTSHLTSAATRDRDACTQGTNCNTSDFFVRQWKFLSSGLNSQDSRVNRMRLTGCWTHSGGLSGVQCLRLSSGLAQRH